MRRSAEIPESAPAAKPVERAAVGDLQLVEGFSQVKTYRHTQNPYPDYRGGTQSWWTYHQDPEAELSWVSAPCPRKTRTVAVFSGSMGEESGEWELWLNGEYALTFQSGVDFSTRSWARGPNKLVFHRKQVTGGNSGVFFLSIPATAVVPGQPLDLRVVPSAGAAGGWFMVKAYTDTVAFENVTPESVTEMEHSAWQEE